MIPSSLRQKPLVLSLQIALAFGTPLTMFMQQAHAQQRVIQLSSLNGGNGFRLDGVAANDVSGRWVSGAGDLNGDGVDDIVIGAEFADPNGLSSGSAYVVFGRSDAAPTATFNLSTLNGSNGFRLDGVAAGDQLGRSASAAGDINGDGIGDLVIGANRAQPNGPSSGSSYVIFGSSAPFPAALNLSTLNSSNGFRLDGSGETELSGERVAAAGDVNGDGVDDLLVGAFTADWGAFSSGSTYVVYGRSSPAFPTTLNLGTLNGANGFRLDGPAQGERAGRALSAGDFNGDNLSDLLIGAYRANSNGTDSGSSYVVFGQNGTPFPAAINLGTLNGSNGFRMTGATAGDHSGYAASNAGDFNGDGVDDLVIGAALADPIAANSGSSHVVFGSSVAAFPATFGLDTLNGTTGFRLNGPGQSDLAGKRVSAAGDVNGDGFGDILIAAGSAVPFDSTSGSSYLLFGRSDLTPATLNLGAVTGKDVLRLDGAGDYSGSSVAAAGDINGDGLDDVLIGADGGDQNGINSGSSYVLFGNSAPMRNGPLAITLPAILEDSESAALAVRDLVAGVYLDGQALVGVGITTGPNDPNGTWQYALSGAPTTAIPDGLAPSNALVVGAAPDGSNAGQVRFAASTDYFGNSPALILRMWDGTGSLPGSEPIVAFGASQNISSWIGAFGGFSSDAHLVHVVQPVLPVNDAPSFIASDPVPVRDDSGLVEIANWATCSMGPANEADQLAAQFVVSAVSNPTLFSSGPTVIANGTSGTLQFATVPGVFGSSTFALRLRDSGGIANGGIDLSASQVFTITITTSASLIFDDGFE
jgi:hypothetical protein